ncbi:Glycosyl transferase family 2 (plasmid) [Pararobbsia alpina]|uniref:glycosyltransferase n=1 Tax=Pararobbsia alpina TaxID=621374 RepID=UPI0039A4CA9A
MLGVVIPAHNESHTIGACVRAVASAISHRQLGGEDARIVVVADACTDDTARLASESGAEVVDMVARNVGMARAAGARHLLSLGARWLAFTDADTIVSPDWLVQQLALRVDVVCGVVQIDDWSAHPETTRNHFNRTYFPIDGHRHIHGANLGVSARAYALAGGFEPLHSSEDVALIRALERTGATIAWSAAPGVTTSARREFRAPNGFGATLLDCTQTGVRPSTSVGHHRPAAGVPSEAVACLPIGTSK